VKIKSVNKDKFIIQKKIITSGVQVALVTYDLLE